MTKLAPVDRAAFAPLYHQLFTTLRDQILAGTYRAGDTLPSERDLARLYGVSRITAQRAVDELEVARFIRREHGRGTFVTEQRAPAPMNANMQALIDNVTSIGAATTGRVIELSECVPAIEVQIAMRLKPNEQVQRSVHVRLKDDAPIGMITTHVPLDIGRRISAADIAARPMLTLLESRGVQVAWAQQAIGAEAASAATASHLDVAVASPLTRLQRVVYDRDDRVVEHLIALYRSDRYELRSVLRREDSQGLL